MWASRHTVSSGPRVYCVQRRRLPGPSTTILPSVSLFSRRSEVKGSQSSGVKRRGICHRKREYLTLSRVWKSLWSIIFQNLSFLLEPFVVKRYVWYVSSLQQALCFSGSASADSINHGSKIFWKKKCLKSSQKENLNLPCTGSYLHYNVFIPIYVAFGAF